MSPVTSSVKLPVERFSTPLNESLPVAPASLPVPLMLDVVAWNSPVATSNVPDTWAVKVALLTVKTMVPSNEATVPEKPVMTKEARVVPWSRPPPMICAVVCPPEILTDAFRVDVVAGNRPASCRRYGGSDDDEQRQDQNCLSSLQRCTSPWES